MHPDKLLGYQLRAIFIAAVIQIAVMAGFIILYILLDVSHIACILPILIILWTILRMISRMSTVYRHNVSLAEFESELHQSLNKVREEEARNK